MHAQPSRLAAQFLAQFDLTGKTVCVTGAASGIGRATACLFAALGAVVLAADRNEPALAQLMRELPDSARAHVYDQADLASVARLAEQVCHADILINNAGVLLYAPLDVLQPADLQHVVAVNLTGAIALTQLVGRAMTSRGRGAVVHTGSQVVGNGAEHRAVYAATKAAISQFVRTAALEWGSRNVRVNCLAPGRTLTEMNRHLLDAPDERAQALGRIPLGRFGLPPDMASAFVFLATEASSYMTGQTLVVDGGWLLV